MSTYLKAGRTIAAIAALVTMAGTQARADATALLGDWRGAGQSAVNARFLEPCLDIERAQGRLFQGELEATLMGELIPCVFPVLGLQGNDGSMTAVGADDDHIIVLSGKTRAMGDGSVRVTALAYVLFNMRGVPEDIGAIAVMQMLGGPRWDEMAGFPVAGGWRGAYHSRFNPAELGLSASLRNSLSEERIGQPTTGIEGAVTFDQVPLGLRGSADLTFNGFGTVNPPEPIRPSTFALIGQGQPPEPIAPAGIIAILIGQGQPPDPERSSIISGNYRLYRNVFDFFQETVQGGNRSFDGGTFSLPAVQ